MSGTGIIVGLHVSDGGVPKRAVSAARVTVDGLEGDRQRDRVHHGGRDRAVCLYAAECIDALRAEGHPITPGAAGENVTIRGLDWSRVEPGVRLQLGEVEVEVTAYTTPCANIRGAFADERFTRISQKLAPGWSRVYARVLHEGALVLGAPVDLIGSSAVGVEE